MSDLTLHRRLTEAEVAMEVYHLHQQMLTSYKLVLNSSQPLQETHLRRALSLLYRKVPILRVCIRPRGSSVFFAEMPEEKVDFQVLEDADPEEEYLARTSTCYDSFNGPLWCVRLIPDKKGAPCPMPEVGRSFPHQYFLIVGFHHGMADATTSYTIFRFLMTLLNDVIAGRPVDDKVQLAKPVRVDQTMKLKKEQVQRLEDDPTPLLDLKDKFERMGGKALIRSAYPVPKGVTPHTFYLTRDLDEATTQKFLKKCKSEGVTLHTAFTAVCNVALVDLLVQAGVKQDSYDITSLHTVNMRRYWEGDMSLAFGNFIDLYVLPALTSKESRLDFWNYARDLCKSFHKGLDNREPITIGCLAELNVGSSQSSNTLVDPYFTTTNVGNLDKLFPGDGDHVQATHVIRMTSYHKLDLLFSHEMQTFRGRFLYSIDYVTSVVSKETTQLYVDTIFKILHSLI